MKSSKKNSNKKRNKKIVIISLVIVFVLLCSLICYKLFKPEFRIKKYNSIIKYEYKDKYKYNPADICYGNYFSCKKIKVNKKGKVNTSKLGKYKVKYEYNYNDKKLVLNQEVEVKDTTKPKLTIETKNALMCPNGKIDTINYKAIDNYDNDITNKVKVKYNKDKNKVIVSVSDSSKNKTVKELDVVKEDKIAPKIELKGLGERNLLVGDTYEDEGATVTDNCDDDIKLNVTNNSNLGVPGTYQIIYSAKDSSGNETSVTRTLNVKSIESGSKIVYLTFDDGPSEYTSELLDILKKYNVKVTFFVTGHGEDSLIKREYDEGHKIALHTNSHDYSYVYSSIDNYFNDLYAVKDRVKRITGEDANLIRFPGGSSNTVSRNYTPGIMSRLVTEVRNRGFYYFDWNVSSGDGGNPTTSDVIYNNVISSLKDGSSVVLQHDTKKYSIDAVERIIQYCQANGYTFATLKDNSPGAHHGTNN